MIVSDVGDDGHNFCNVLDAPPFQLLASDGFNPFLLVEGIPEFGDDYKVLTLHNPFVDSSLDTYTSLFFIPIICIIEIFKQGPEKTGGKLTECAVKQPISCLDGVVDDICCVFGDFPETEPEIHSLGFYLTSDKKCAPDLGDLVVVVELDLGYINHFVEACGIAMKSGRKVILLKHK